MTKNKTILTIGILIVILSLIVWQKDFFDFKKENWQTYYNSDLGFYFDYPASYQDFTKIELQPEDNNKYDLYVFATSSEKIPTDEEGPGIKYMTFPRLSLSATNLDELIYNNGYGRVTKYDKINSTFYHLNHKDERQNLNPSLTGEGWRALQVGTGDAGLVDRSYLIVSEKKDLGLKISFTGSYKTDDNGVGFHTHRDLDINKIIKTFKFEN